MNEKAFMRRAQKLSALAVQTKKRIECQIKRFDDGVLRFSITHYDKRYGADDSPHNNRSIFVYTFESESKTGFSNQESFINKLLSGEDALIEY